MDQSRESSSLFGSLMAVSLLLYVIIVGTLLAVLVFPVRDVRELLYQGFEHRAEAMLGDLHHVNAAVVAQAREALLKEESAGLLDSALEDFDLSSIDRAEELPKATRDVLKDKVKTLRERTEAFADALEEDGADSSGKPYRDLLKASASLGNVLTQADQHVLNLRSDQKIWLSKWESRLVMILAAFALLGAIAIVMVSRFFKIQVWTPVSRILRYTQRVEQGDLSVELEEVQKEEGLDELGKIARAVHNLGATIRNIFQAIQSHGTDAGQIAASLDQHCKGLIQQHAEQGRALENLQHRLQDSVGLVEDFKTGAMDVHHYAGEVTGRFSDLQVSSQHLLEQSKDVHQNVSACSQSADGLSRNTDQVLSELARMREGMQETQNGSEALLGKISDLTDQTALMTNSVDEASAIVEEMMTGNHQVLENIRSMDQNMDMAFAQFEGLLGSIKLVDERIRESTSFSREVAKTAGEGSQIVEQAIEKMREIKAMVQATAKQIKDLGSSSQEITNVVSTITGLAEQTNLLALNAAIEAARAGEEGEGFAVVADKVRQLAEQSSRSAKEIEGHIMEVQQETDKVVQGMVEWGRQVEEGVSLADNAGKKMSSIVEKVRHSNLLMHDINNTTQEQTKKSDKVKQVMEKLTSASQVIRQSVQEQEVGSRRMVDAIVTLRDVAQHLKNGVADQEEAGRSITHAVEHQKDIGETLSRKLSDHRQVCSNLQRNLQGASRTSSEVHHLVRQQLEKHKDLLTAGDHVVEETRRLADRGQSELSRVQQLSEEIKQVVLNSRKGHTEAQQVYEDAQVLTTTIQQLLDILVDFRLEAAPGQRLVGTAPEDETGLRPVEEP